MLRQIFLASVASLPLTVAVLAQDGAPAARHPPMLTGTPPAPATECDRLSTMPPERLVTSPDEPGIRFSKGGGDEELDPIVAACRAAMEQYPSESRFTYRLGIALRAKLDGDGAREALLMGTLLGSPGAFDEMASILLASGSVEEQRNGIALLEEAVARFDHPELKRGLAAALARDIGGRSDKARAFSLLEEASGQNHLPAIVDLGMSYEFGAGVEKNPETAAQLYETAEIQGSAYGAYRLGELYRDGPAEFRDMARAVQFYTRAGERGFAAAFNRLGQIASAGQAGPRDYDLALRHYSEAATRGYVPAMANIANLYANGAGRPIDYGLAREWYQKAFARGNACAGSSVGMLYDHGRGVKQDMAEAFRWYEKSAARNCSTAVSNLGYAYQNGRGVPVDQKRALGYFERAASLGDAAALTNLAYAYKHGLMGLAKDLAKARDYYERAVAAGNATAMNNLGMMYIEGDGVARDREKGMALVRRAADLFDLSALNNLGYFSERTDKALSRQYYEKAIALGSVPAKRNLARVLARSPDDSEDAIRANKLYRELASEGDAKALYDYANRLDDAGCHDGDLRLSDDDDKVAEDCEAAVRSWLGKAVVAGDRQGLERLAEMVAEGEGGPADPQEAERLYKQAEAKGDAEIAMIYARRLRAGEGLVRNQAEARRLYLKYAGTEESAGYLAVDMMLAGEGGPRDARTAAALLKRLSDGGQKRAGLRLAQLLRQGDRDLSADPAQARNLLVFAVFKGFEPARLPLADMLLKGEGGDRDPEMALTVLRSGERNAEARLRAASLLEKGEGVKRDPDAALAELRFVADRLADARACLPLAQSYAGSATGKAGGEEAAKAAAENYLCALANGSPEARALLLKSDPKLPRPVLLAIKAQLAQFSDRQLSAGPRFDAPVRDLLGRLQAAVGKPMRDDGTSYFQSMLSGWRRPIVGREAEARGAEKPENIGWKIAYRMRDAWHARLRELNADELKQSGDLPFELPKLP